MHSLACENNDIKLYYILYIFSIFGQNFVKLFYKAKASRVHSATLYANY